MSSSSDEFEEICPTPDTNAGTNEHILPAKSRERYIATYENFITWQTEKNTSSFCEEVLMAYFEEIANKYKPTTLCAIYSMLKHGLKSNHGVNMEEYVSLSVFLKKLSKGYVSKKAKTLTIENVEKFIEEAPDDKYLATKVALILGVTGGFRPRELSEITTNNIENHGEIFVIKVPHTKNRKQRSFVIQGKYYNIVKKYQSLRTAKKGVSTRFFQQFRNGKCSAQVTGKNKFGMMPREIAEFLNLPNAKDYTGHSFRKAFTTQDLEAKFNLKRQALKSSVPETHTDESFNDTNTDFTDQCRFCGQFSKDCVIVSTHMPYLSGHRTTLALNDTSVQLDFSGALPNTVCQFCDAKLQAFADFFKVVKDAQELINGKIKTECEEDNDMAEIDADFIKTEVDTESAAINSISISDTVFIKSVSHKIKSDTNQKAKVSKPNVMVQCASDVDIKQEIDEDLENSRLSHSDTHADSGTLSILDELKQTFCEIADDTCVNEVSRKKIKISDSETRKPQAVSVASRCRPLCDAEIESAFFYGSDGEDSDDDENAEEFSPTLIPRVIRPYLPNEDSDEEEPDPLTALTIDDSWPPTQPVVFTVPLVVDPPEEPAAAADSVAASDSLGAPYPIKFNFEWKHFPRPKILPELRREPFFLTSGPTACYEDPYDAFVAIWDQSIMQHIANQTNKYAQELADKMIQQTISPNSRITKWVDTTPDELYTYFAIMLAMGIVVKSRLDEYWQTSKDIFWTPEFSTAMAFDRFHLLNRCLHFNDNDSCTPDRMTRNEAKLHKILPIVQHLNDKFSSLYMLSRNITLDESLTQWKGWLNIKQHIPNKAAKVGVKTYELCESLTGYLWRFEVEAQQFAENVCDSSPISGKIPTLVLRLLRGLEHRGHTIWMDNYYNSPALARELKLLGFDCVGTLGTNRQLVPSELSNLQNRDLPVGQVSGCTSGDVDIIVWRDKKRIALISTYHGLTTVDCGDKIKPALILDYNVCMGGVDRKDQLLAMYPIERKQTAIWYKKFFRRLLNVSVLNAYVLTRANQSISHRNFRKSLVAQLLHRHNKYMRAQPPVIALIDRHMPQYFDRIHEAGKVRYRRRQCVVCAKKTHSYCGACGGKTLCVPSCFYSYHLQLPADKNLNSN